MSNSQAPIPVSVRFETSEALDKLFDTFSLAPGETEKAIRSAIKRSAKHGTTVYKRLATKRYDIKSGDIGDKNSVKLRYVGAVRGSGAKIEFTGKKIATSKYRRSSKEDVRDKSVKYRVLIRLHDGSVGWRMVNPGKNAKAALLKGKRVRTLSNTFVAHMGDHTGIYERLKGKRTKSGLSATSEKVGLSLPQMAGNEGVVMNISDEMLDTFNKRVEHEMVAILKGYRRSSQEG